MASGSSDRSPTRTNIPEEATRATVEAMWRGVIAGEVSREDAHRWAARWVEGDVDADDLMTRSGLQHLHGFDMVWADATQTATRHGGPGTYVHPLDDVVQALDRWRAKCARYDADPEEFHRQVRQAARSD